MMKTNDIKKGDRVALANGWYGTMKDNMRGNRRMVEVEGFFTEIGSVYSHDIVYAKKAGEELFQRVEHTPAQIKLRAQVDAIFG